MTDKQLTYSVKLDLASAQAQAAQLRSLFQAELSHIQFSLLDPSALNNALSGTSAIRAQFQQIAQDAHLASQSLAQANAGGAQQLLTQYNTIATDAERIAQAMQHAAQQRPQAPAVGGGQGGSGNVGIGGLAQAGLQLSAIQQGAQIVKQVADQAMGFAELGTQIRRTESAFRILSGSEAEATARITAIKNASAGTIDTMQAMQVANQAASLGMANTAQEMGSLVRAAREITLVSSSIHDVQDAMAQLSQFSNSGSFNRADQLGLNPEAVKKRIKELQDANAGMSDSEAKLTASTQLLDENFGKLLDSSEAAASGAEKLKVALADVWAEIAKGPVGKEADNTFSNLAKDINQARVMLGSKDAGVISGTIDGLVDELKKKAEQFDGIPLMGTAAQNKLAGFEALKTVMAQVNAGVAAGIPIASEYQRQVDEIGISAIRWGHVSDAEVTRLHEIQNEYASAAVAQQKLLDVKKATANQDAVRTQRQDQVDKLLEPVSTLGSALKDSSVANFFQSLQDGLMKSAELTATESNKVAELRQQLVGIGQAVAESNGTISAAQRQRVAAINEQIAALTEAAKLNKELQQAKPAAGQDLEGIYTRLNAIIAQAGNTMTETATKARLLGDAIAQSGQASPVELGMIDAMAAQVNQADFSQITQALNELNQGSLDAVPGVDALRSKLAEYYDTLASGKGLSAEEAADMNMLMSQADALGGSTSALAGIQSELGYKFLESHDYAASLVEQIANLDALYGAGKIGADQFAGGMSVLTSELYRQLDAAGVLTPALRELLALQSAVAGSRVAPGQAGGGIYTGNPGERKPGLSPGFVSGQRQAEAAAALARSKADTTARDEMRKANDRAARGAQSAFENAASATQKAFKDVTDKIISALEKVPGLFKTSDVTQGDMDKAAAGGSVNFADDFVRRFANVAEGKKNIGVSAEDVKAALARIGVQGSNDNKALLAQLKEHWNDSSLFANKENLKLINADAVKDATKLQGQANEGKQNILEYFGATIDAVKEKFKAGDPDIVAAVADDLAGSNDKNIKAMGDQLKAGGQKIIDKVLAMAQASIDKTVGSLGSGASAGGGGGITVPTVSVGTPTGKGGTTGSAGGFLDGTAFAGGVVPVTAQITNILPSATPLAPIPVTAQLTVTQASVTSLLTGLTAPTLTIADVHVASTVGQTILTDIANALATKVADFKSQGSTIRGAIESGFTGNEKDRGQGNALGDAIYHAIGDGLQAHSADFTAQGATARKSIEDGFLGNDKDRGQGTPLSDAVWNMIGNGLGAHSTDLQSQGDTARQAIEKGFKGDGKTNVLGDAVFHMIGDGLQAHQQAFVNDGKTILNNIKSGMDTISKGEDGALTSSLTGIAQNYVEDLGIQFSAQTEAITAIGTNISGLITKGVTSTDFSKQIQDALNASNLDKETEGKDGKIRKKPAMDFSSTASQITESLSKAMGGQTALLSGIGDTASTYIGFGMTDHDFSGTADTLIGSMKTSFTTEQARTQLIAAGAALSGAVFAGFQQSLAYSPWLSAIVAEVVSQAATSLNSSLQDSLKPQALGF